jgi:hypothetical protein
MNRSERLALVDHDDPALAIVAQCRLLKVARSTLYYRPVAVSADDLAVMRRIDELHLAVLWIAPNGGRSPARRLAGEPQAGQRLMRVMGIEALYQKPNTSKGHPEHKIYPYLLRGLTTTGRTRCGARTSHTSRWPKDLSIWWRWVRQTPSGTSTRFAVRWTGSAGGFCRGGCRSPWRRTFASRRRGKRLNCMASRKFSTPIRVCNSPAPRSWTSWRAAVFGSAWTARAVSGQYFHRAAVAEPEIRRCVYQGVWLSCRGAPEPEHLAGVLQRRAPASVTGISDAARNFRRRCPHAHGHIIRKRK